jgi:hypothetical protein
MENLIAIVDNQIAQAEQQRDRAQMDCSTFQNIAASAAIEICDTEAIGEYEIAAIIYKHLRNGKEL